MKQLALDACYLEGKVPGCTEIFNGPPVEVKHGGHFTGVFSLIGFRHAPPQFHGFEGVMGQEKRAGLIACAHV
jgi:hypothetical protein